MEDVGHFVLRCAHVLEERERMERLMGEREPYGKYGGIWRRMKARLVAVMDRACWDDPARKAMERLWQK